MEELKEQVTGKGGLLERGRPPRLELAAGWAARSNRFCDSKFRERCLAKGQFGEGRTVTKKEALSAKLVKPEKEDFVCAQRFKTERNWCNDSNEFPF